MTAPQPVVLVTGEEIGLVGEAVREVVSLALGRDDRSLALEELTEDDYRTDDGFEVARLVDAAQTPPLLSERRVVVGRHLGRFGDKEAIAPLVAYLADPLETTALVVVWEKGAVPVQQRLNPVPKSLLEAVVNAGGEVRKTSVGRGREAQQWLDDRLDEAPVELDRSARVLVHSRLGEDRPAVVPFLETLAAVFGTGAALGAEDVTPFLRIGGDVAPWDLGDAIDQGDVPKALDCLSRMMGAGGRHPLAVLSVLHGHYGRLLRLDGSGISDEKGAADALGIKGYPAKKALQTSRQLGGDRISRAVKLLGDADLDLRGRSAWPSELVAEVLVARLASLSRR